MASSTLPAVLAEIRSVLKTLPGLNPDEYPSAQDEQPIVCLVYPGSGRAQLGTSSNDSGRPSYWEFDTVVIDIVTPQSDMAADYKAVEPYAQGVPTALFAAFSNDRFNGKITTMSDPYTPGSTWPIRRSLIYPVSGGVDVLGYRFEVDVSYQVDIIHD